MSRSASPKLVQLGTEPRLFVFDINVWIDVALLLGPLPTPQTREHLVSSLSMRPVPDRAQPDVDSFRCWQMAASGIFVQPLEASLFISEYMLETLWRKLQLPEDGPTPELRGLGWDDHEAEDFIEDAVLSIAYTPEDLGVKEPVGPWLNPPLDHEDGMVLACARSIGAHYLITGDSDFDRVRDQRSIKPTLTICTPTRLVGKMRQLGRTL